MQPTKLKILVIGGGAREHALVWKLHQSPKVEEIYAAPGNAGTAAIARNLNIRPTDLTELVEAATTNHIDLAVVGPEAPLAEGIIDLFADAGIPAFGPTKAATTIESSKVFAKELMHRYGIPCAKSAAFSSFDEASAYIKQQSPPIVVKADGLAAGKGSIMANSMKQALTALSNIMVERVFGAAGDQVLIEECLFGREVSLIAFTDGETVVPMVPACDYKPVFDNDQGPNTGGMGSYSPPSFFGDELTNQVKRTVLEPTVRAMTKEGKSYKGVLYAGLMITPEGPKVLEFNARFGDPETQVTLPRLKTDLVDILLAVINNTLDQIKVEWSEDACVGVVMASGGYPGSYSTGFPITGLDRLDDGILVFHAGTKVGEGGDGQIETAGGRVLTVVATGKTIVQARNRVYLNLPCLRFEGCHYRKDIAAREVDESG